MPSVDLSQSRSLKPRPFDFCQAARSCERAFRHWADSVHGGQYIKCSKPFTPCCDNNVHVQCWIIVALEEDYKCPLCGQFYQFWNIDNSNLTFIALNLH